MKIEQRKSDLKLLKSLSNWDMKLVKKIPKLKQIQKKFFNDLINENIYFWDYGFMLEMERIYLTYLYNNLLEEKLFVGYERECERIKLCINLLDIIQGKEDPAHLVLDKSVKTVEDIINHDNNHWELKKYVNIRNAKRFLCDELINKWLKGYSNLSIITISHLYEIKAWYLYHKMRINWMKGWWS